MEVQVSHSICTEGELLETDLVAHDIFLLLILDVLFNCPFVLSNCVHVVPSGGAQGLPSGQLFEIHGSKLEPHPFGDLGQTSIKRIAHTVLFFGIDRLRGWEFTPSLFLRL